MGCFPSGIEFLFWEDNYILKSIFCRVCPLGLVSYIAASILTAPDVRTTIPSLGYFILAIMAAVAVHQVIVLQVLYAGITRTNPFKLQLRLFKSWILLLGTSRR
jgi:Na+/H+-dicarboxylate symporter